MYSTEDGEYSVLEWEPAEVPLPADLVAVYHRFPEDLLRIDARDLFGGCPRLAGVKSKAELKNHRQDVLRQADKVRRQVQQKLMVLQRV